MLHRGIPGIDQDRCIGCNLCGSACPHSCLEVIDGVAVLVNSEVCRGEAFCIAMCPKGAMRMVKRVPGQRGAKVLGHG